MLSPEAPQGSATILVGGKCPAVELLDVKFREGSNQDMLQQQCLCGKVDGGYLTCILA